MKIAITRHINGIFINGTEYLLGDDGNVLIFNAEEYAVKYLSDSLSITEKEVIDLISDGSIMLREYQGE